MSKKNKQSLLFKTLEEERAWRHKNMLTVQKLIDWLQKQDPDQLVYAIEPNTQTWQEIPDDFPSRWFRTLAEQKADEEEMLKGWYRGSKDLEKKVKERLEASFQYTEDKGICILA